MNHRLFFSQTKNEYIFPHVPLPWNTSHRLNGIDKNEMPCKSQNFITYQKALAETKKVEVKTFYLIFSLLHISAAQCQDSFMNLLFISCFIHFYQGQHAVLKTVTRKPNRNPTENFI